MGPRKEANYDNDLRRWAELCGAELIAGATEMKPSPRLACRGALVAKEEGKFREYHYAAYRARWAEARNIGDPAIIRTLLAGAGLDANAALERAQSEELRGQLTDASHAAVKRGVFGVPTLFVSDEMFWGNDLFELARFYIQKKLRKKVLKSNEFSFR